MLRGVLDAFNPGRGQDSKRRTDCRTNGRTDGVRGLGEWFWRELWAVQCRTEASGRDAVAHADEVAGAVYLASALMEGENQQCLGYRGASGTEIALESAGTENAFGVVRTDAEPSAQEEFSQLPSTLVDLMSFSVQPVAKEGFSADLAHKVLSKNGLRVDARRSETLAAPFVRQVLVAAESSELAQAARKTLQQLTQAKALILYDENIVLGMQKLSLALCRAMVYVAAAVFERGLDCQVQGAVIGENFRVCQVRSGRLRLVWESRKDETCQNMVAEARGRPNFRTEMRILESWIASENGQSASVNGASLLSSRGLGSYISIHNGPYGAQENLQAELCRLVRNRTDDRRDGKRSRRTLALLEMTAPDAWISCSYSDGEAVEWSTPMAAPR